MRINDSEELFSNQVSTAFLSKAGELYTGLLMLYILQKMTKVMSAEGGLDGAE